jgi:hypothetical protein
MSLDYLAEKELVDDLNKNGNLVSAAKLLEISHNGENQTYNPVQGVIVAIEHYVKERKEDSEYLKSALLTLETIASARNSNNEYFSASNASLALRVLARNEEFHSLGITPVKIIDFAKNYNEKIAGRQYKISGEVNYLDGNYQAKICLNPYSIEVVEKAA